MRKAVVGAAVAVVLLVAMTVALSVRSSGAQRQKDIETQRGWIADDLARLAEAKLALETKYPDWQRLSGSEAKGLFHLKAQVRHCIFVYDHHLSFYEMCQKEAIPKEAWVTELEEALERSAKPGSSPTPEPAGRAVAFDAYVFDRFVTGAAWMHPDELLRQAGRRATDREAALLLAEDGRPLRTRAYQVYRTPNRGRTRVTWVGHADGNHQVHLRFWNGDAYVVKDILGAVESGAHSVLIDLPPKVEHISVVVNCTRGSLYTDRVEFRHEDRSTPRGARPPRATGVDAGIEDDSDVF
ncbi:MAG: hypothetical protein ACYS9X_07570 [Planctomycetota bacterium]